MNLSEHSFTESVNESADVASVTRFVRPTQPTQLVGADYRGSMAYNVDKTDEQWRAELSAEEYAVLRQAGTERPFVGEYTDTETIGTYRCKACQAKLFESDTKFHSGCGWPSFYQPISDTIEYIEDTTHGHEAGRGALRQLRLAPRPRLPRRLRHARPATATASTRSACTLETGEG